QRDPRGSRIHVSEYVRAVPEAARELGSTRRFQQRTRASTLRLRRTTMATGKIIINLYDGTRQLVPAGTRVLLTVTDGNKRTVFRDFVQGPTVTMNVPFFDNLGDQYTVIASPDKGLDAGFFPVKVSPTVDRPVFLMLLPKERESQFNFASWKDLQQHS